jgi:hypothetical protein
MVPKRRSIGTRVAFGDEGDGGEMAGDDLAEADEDEVARFVDHGVERVDVAQHAHDLQLLLVQRIADEVALDRERILHEARGVEGADGLVHARRRARHLAAARPAGHEVRLDEAGRDAQLGLDEAAVDLHRRAARAGDAEIDMIFVVAGEVVGDARPSRAPRDRRPVRLSSAPSFGRCRPVATSTLMRSLRNARPPSGPRSSGAGRGGSAPAG